MLRDLALDVPHGETVTIPANRAYKSKDLWMALGQRQLFRLNPGGPGNKPIAPPQAPPVITVPHPAQVTPVQSQPSPVEVALVEENEALKNALSAQSIKLDSILSLLQAGISASVIQASINPPVQQVPSKRESGAVFSDIPTFIPSNITPEGSESRIEMKPSETLKSDVSGAAEKLRALRQKKQT